jgi:hypothetical protein
VGVTGDGEDAKMGWKPGLLGVGVVAVSLVVSGGAVSGLGGCTVDRSGTRGECTDVLVFVEPRILCRGELFTGDWSMIDGIFTPETSTTTWTSTAGEVFQSAENPDELVRFVQGTSEGFGTTSFTAVARFDTDITLVVSRRRADRSVVCVAETTPIRVLDPLADGGGSHEETLRFTYDCADQAYDTWITERGQVASGSIAIRSVRNDSAIPVLLVVKREYGLDTPPEPPLVEIPLQPFEVATDLSGEFFGVWIVQPMDGALPDDDGCFSLSTGPGSGPLVGDDDDGVATDQQNRPPIDITVLLTCGD